MKKYKTFQGNLDGRRQGLIIAKSKKDAVAIIGFSLCDFNKYWNEVINIDQSKFKRNTLYTKPFGGLDSYNREWQEGRCEMAPRHDK